jgi:autotransporter-associated beta strand protein
MKKLTLPQLFASMLPRVAALLLAAAGGVGIQAQTTYTWAPGGVQDADGTWDTTTGNWLPGSVAWPNNTSPGDKAQFGLVTTNRIVTLSGTIHADSLLFSDLRTGFGQDWTLTGGTLNLVGNALIDTRDDQNAVRIDSLITGSAGLTLTNSTASRSSNAELRLANDNTFTGITKIYGSVIALYRTNALGPSGFGNEVEIYAKGRMMIGGLNGGSTPLSVSKNVRFKSNDSTTTALRSSNAHNTFDGDIVNEVVDAGINVNTPHTFTVNGTITSEVGPQPRLYLSASAVGSTAAKLRVNSTISDGPGSFTRLLIDSSPTPANVGTVELTGTNTFTGSITLRRGTLLMSSEDAVGWEPGANVWIGDGGLNNSGSTLAFLINGPYKMGRFVGFSSAAGANTYIGVIGGSTAHTSEFTAPITISDNNAGTYCVTAAAGGTVLIKSWFRDSNTNKLLTKIGPGTVILEDGGNRFGAGVDVKEGTLLVNNGYYGSATFTNTVTVRSNATFGGFGCAVISPVIYQNDAKAWFRLSPIDTGESNSTYMVFTNTVTFNTGNVVRVHIADTNPVVAGTYTLAISEAAIVTNAPLSVVIESGTLDPSINVTNVTVDNTGKKLLLVLDTVAAPPTPPTLSSVVHSGGNVLITFSGPNGQTYQVLTSTNVMAPITNWVPVSTGTFGASPVVYTNPTPNDPQRFYRIASP